MASHSKQYRSRSMTHYVRARKASSRFFRTSNSSSWDPCFDWDGPKPEEGPPFGRLSSGIFELVVAAVLAILGSANSGGSSSPLGIDSCERKKTYRNYHQLSPLKDRTNLKSSLIAAVITRRLPTYSIAFRNYL